jgi:hypothetical protein
MADDSCYIRLSEAELSRKHGEWIGNDEKGGYVSHGKVT